MTEYERLLVDAAELRLFAQYSLLFDLQEKYREEAEWLEAQARALLQTANER